MWIEVLSSIQTTCRRLYFAGLGTNLCNDAVGKPIAIRSNHGQQIGYGRNCPPRGLLQPSRSKPRRPTAENFTSDQFRHDYSREMNLKKIEMANSIQRDQWPRIADDSHLSGVANSARSSASSHKTEFTPHWRQVSRNSLREISASVAACSLVSLPISKSFIPDAIFASRPNDFSSVPSAASQLVGYSRVTLLIRDYVTAEENV